VTTCQLVCDTAEPAKPMTWAALASRNAGGPSTPVTSSSANSAVRRQTAPDAKSDDNQPSKTAW